MKTSEERLYCNYESHDNTRARRVEVIKERVYGEGNILRDLPLESINRNLRKDNLRLKSDLEEKEKEINKLKKDYEKLQELVDFLERRNCELEEEANMSPDEQKAELKEKIKELEEKFAKRTKEVTSLQRKCGNYRIEVNKFRKHFEKRNKESCSLRAQVEMLETQNRVQSLINYKNEKDGNEKNI